MLGAKKSLLPITVKASITRLLVEPELGVRKLIIKEGNGIQTMTEISRQVKWQRKQIAAHRCRICKKPEGIYKGLCNYHIVMMREHSRKRMGTVKRNKSKTYNLKESQLLLERENND